MLAHAPCVLAVLCLIVRDVSLVLVQQRFNTFETTTHRKIQILLRYNPVSINLFFFFAFLKGYDEESLQVVGPRMSFFFDVVKCTSNFDSKFVWVFIPPIDSNQRADSKSAIRTNGILS